jgi:hypothetical protein
MRRDNDRARWCLVSSDQALRSLALPRPIADAERERLFGIITESLDHFARLANTTDVQRATARELRPGRVCHRHSRRGSA